MKINRILSSALYALLLLCTMCLMSCSKDSDNNSPEIIQEEDRYYVKYEVKVVPQYSKGDCITSISCLGDKGDVKIDTKERTWEATYGPIKKDSHLYLYVSCDRSASTQNDSYARIWVSKNKEPFVLKAEDRGTTSLLRATCGIDF